MFPPQLSTFKFSTSNFYHNFQPLKFSLCFPTWSLCLNFWTFKFSHLFSHIKFPSQFSTSVFFFHLKIPLCFTISKFTLKFLTLCLFLYFCYVFFSPSNTSRFHFRFFNLCNRPLSIIEDKDDGSGKKKKNQTNLGLLEYMKVCDLVFN